MPDTGAPWNIPYAAPADLVRDWPDLSEDVAIAVAAGLDDAFSIIQIVQTVKTDTFSTTSTSLTDITGLSATITPTSNTSLVLALLTIGALDGSATNVIYGDVTRGGTPVGIGDASGSRGRASWATSNATVDRPTSVSWSFRDSPATAAAITYQARIRAQTGTVYVNRASSNVDSILYFTSVSTLTLIEVAP
jgi:hypothetical protein